MEATTLLSGSGRDLYVDRYSLDTESQKVMLGNLQEVENVFN